MPPVSANHIPSEKSVFTIIGMILGIFIMVLVVTLIEADSDKSVVKNYPSPSQVYIFQDSLDTMRQKNKWLMFDLIVARSKMCK